MSSADRPRVKIPFNLSKVDERMLRSLAKKYSAYFDECLEDAHQAREVHQARPSVETQEHFDMATMALCSVSADLEKLRDAVERFC